MKISKEEVDPPTGPSLSETCWTSVNRADWPLHYKYKEFYIKLDWTVDLLYPLQGSQEKHSNNLPEYMHPQGNKYRLWMSRLFIFKDLQKVASSLDATFEQDGGRNVVKHGYVMARLDDGHH